MKESELRARCQFVGRNPGVPGELQRELKCHLPSFLESQVHLNSLAFKLRFLLPKMFFLRSPGALARLVRLLPREERLWHKPMFPPTYLVAVNGTYLPNKFKKEGKRMIRNRNKEGKKSLVLCNRTLLFT